MKLITLFLLSLASAHAQQSELPRKAPVTRYAGLISNSMFTTPKPVEKPIDPNPLEDFALGGITPIQGGYSVTLINRKKPDERVSLPNDPAYPEFKVISVEYVKDRPLETTVRIASGSKQGSVGFVKELLTKRAPAAPQPNPNGQPNPAGAPPLPNGMPGGAPGQANPAATDANGRPPRPRVAAAPTAPGGAPQQQQQTRPAVTRPPRR